MRIGAPGVRLRQWWSGLGGGEKAAYGSAIIASAIGAMTAIIIAIVQTAAGGGATVMDSAKSTADDPLPPIPPTTAPPTIAIDPPTDTPTSEPSPNYGTALKFKIQSAGSTQGPDDVAFPASQKDQIKRFNELLGPSNTPVPQGSIPDGIRSEMRYGGYALAGLYIAMHIENTSSRALSISNIRVIKQRKQPIATGAVFYMPSGAGDAHSIFLELDQPDPIPRIVTPETDPDKEGPHSERPFFRTMGLPIKGNGKSDYLDIIFAAQRGAYDFTVAFDYTFQGDDRKYVQILTNGGQPWRVTGWACNYDSSGESRYKPNLRYGFVRVMGFTDEYVTRVSDPAHGCSRD